MIKEIIVVFVLIMTAIWTPDDSLSVAKLFGICAAGLVVVSWRYRGDSGYNLGLCPLTAAKPGFYLFGLTAVFATAIVLAGVFIEPTTFGKKDLLAKIHKQALGTYILWGMFQQLILNGYFANRLGALMKGCVRPALLAGLLFGVVHLPNPVLTIGTFLWGTVSAYFFLRYSRNIYFLGIAHSVLGTLTKYFIAIPLIGHGAMRIGPGFLR